MAVDAFLSMVSFFIFLCGGALVFSAWPRRLFWPSLSEVLSLTLGGIMVLSSGYGLAMIIA